MNLNKYFWYYPRWAQTAHEENQSMKVVFHIPLLFLGCENSTHDEPTIVLRMTNL